MKRMVSSSDNARPQFDRSILASLRYSLRGIAFAVYSQKHMVVHLVLGGVAIGFGLFFQLARWEWAYLFLTVTLVILTEILNTSIEVLVDLTTRKRRIRARLSKDLAAGSVLVSALHALLAAYLLFFDRMVSLVSNLIGGL